VPVARAAAVPAPPEAPAAPDLSPVPEPSGLVLVARWRQPLNGIVKALGVPVSMEDLLGSEVGELARFVDFNGTVDGAVVLDREAADQVGGHPQTAGQVGGHPQTAGQVGGHPQTPGDDPGVLGAVSIPIKSFDEARAEFEKDSKVTSLRPGVVRIEKSKSDKVGCDLAASPDGGARLVCSDSVRAVEALRDWLARGLPSSPAWGARAVSAEASGSTLTVRAGPFKDRYLSVLRARAAKVADEAHHSLTAQGVGDPDLLGAPQGVLDEGVRFLEDLDRLDVRASLDPDGRRLKAGASLRFAGRSAWLTQVLTDANDRASGPPETFFRLPREASWAGWGRGADPRLFDGVRRVLHKAVVEVLGRAPISPADKASVEAFVDGVPVSSGASVWSSGSVPLKKKTGDVLADAKALITSTVGWSVWGVEAPAAEYVAWTKQGVDVYGRAVRVARSFAGKDPAVLDQLPRVTSTSSPPGWPRGTVAFDAAFHVDSDLAAELLSRKPAPGAGVAPRGPVGILRSLQKGKATPAGKVAMNLRLAIVPDGNRTWIGFSADLDILKKRMSAVIPGAPAEGTLAARAREGEGSPGKPDPSHELAALRKAGQTAGGFVNLGDLLDQVLEAVERESPANGVDARALLAALPNRGRTPILFSGTGASGPAPSIGVELSLEPGTVADLAALGTFLVSPLGKKFLDKL
jgi:hypothetical protein